ncbi:MAG TPA: glycosyltransferase family 2 protein [Thermoanaerobaculia bacterium]|nr:glycosyltransferase family 2 protein [Thermoanaerobaculia bacterium]
MSTALQGVHPDHETMPRSDPAAGAARPVDVSVVIISWNSGRWIERCLASIPAAAGSLSWETIVWDNASSDRSATLAERMHAENTEVIASPVNRGFAGGINEVLPRLRGRHVFLLNPDCAPEPRSIETLGRFLDAGDAAGAAPMLVGEDGRTQREFQLRRFPTLRSILADVLLFEEIHPSNRASRSYRYGDLDVTRAQPVEQPAAAALMLQRGTLERVGAFDERFLPAWFEDVDYCRRIAESGGTLLLVPSARVVHSGGSTLEVLGFGAFHELWYRNLHRYAAKWLRRPEAEAVRWGIMVGMILRGVATTIGFRGGAPSRREALRAWHRVLRQAWRRWDETSRSS